MSGGYGNTKLQVGDDPVDAANPVPVEVVNVTTPVELTGDLIVDTLGALDNAKVTNPDAASATIPALLRGALKQQVDILAKIIAAPATSAKQDDIITAITATNTKLDTLIAAMVTANAHLAAIETNTGA